MDGLFGTEASRGVFARIAVERGLDRIADRSLTYRLDGESDAGQVGQCVEVPLGKGNKTARGVIMRVGGVELVEGIDPSTIKPVKRLIGAPLPDSLLELAEWVSSYYVCPLGMVFATMVPSAVKKRVGVRSELHVELTGETPDPKELPPATRRAWEAIAALEASTFPIKPGDLVGRIESKTRGPINRLIERGVLREVTRRRVVAPPMAWDPGGEGDAPAPPKLTDAQHTVVGGILEQSFSETRSSFGVHLLRGVTGSGKTEVYLRIIESVLARGLGAIVMVPEISLTPQTMNRFVDRFGESGVAVLHSGLTASQRHAQWDAVASGAARVVIGARSAVFAPMRDVGIIVVDEEHDDSGYKQDQLPRYHGRDVAVKRAQLESCPILLGSATPSLESWFNALNKRYALWELTDRVGGGEMPVVGVVDIAEERRQLARQSTGSLPFRLVGPTLEGEMRRALDDGSQCLLLLNRRGHASYISCPDAGCGWTFECDQCDAAMVQHRTDGGRLRFVRCHHCQSERRVPAECPLCGKRTIALGGGTQRLEDELVHLFGASHNLNDGQDLVRVDGDTMRSARDYFSALGAFAAGRVRVLIGTQMIAKGLDVPNVRLVGVVNADVGLGMPDFRASERVFQLLMQVAGRAGRRDASGRVIVQTMSPMASAVRLASRHDFVGFATSELALRERAMLPPVTRMARVVCRDQDREKAESAAKDLGSALRQLGSDRTLRIEGPGPCPISRIGGFWRFEIVVTAEQRSQIQRAFTMLRDRGMLKSDARTAVDVDPVSIL